MEVGHGTRVIEVSIYFYFNLGPDCSLYPQSGGRRAGSRTDLIMTSVDPPKYLG